MSDELKRQAAIAALEFVEEDTVIGVGTGSTANFFIDELAKIKANIAGTVPSSKESEKRLRDHGIPVVDINADMISVYIDGADEFNKHCQLIKGGGGALTREKIVAACSRKFVCIVDESKQVNVLGEFPVAVEVVPMARSHVAREIVTLGGDPVLRENFVTDNGNQILDVYNLKITEPLKLEMRLNNITGVVCNGIFAIRPADVVMMATANGIKHFNP